FYPKVVRDDFGARVEATLAGPLKDLFRARTMLDFAFPLPSVTLGAGDDPLASAVARALASDAARAVFDAFVRGPVRYRIAWAEGGKRRASIFRVASEARALDPRLVNDPKDSLVSVIVRARGADLRVELAPRVADPRFA